MGCRCLFIRSPRQLELLNWLFYSIHFFISTPHESFHHQAQHHPLLPKQLMALDFILFFPLTPLLCSSRVFLLCALTSSSSSFLATSTLFGPKMRIEMRLFRRPFRFLDFVDENDHLQDNLTYNPTRMHSLLVCCLCNIMLKTLWLLYWKRRLFLYLESQCLLPPCEYWLCYEQDFSKRMCSYQVLKGWGQKYICSSFNFI